jgi:protein import protein ZIM17
MNFPITKLLSKTTSNSLPLARHRLSVAAVSSGSSRKSLTTDIPARCLSTFSGVCHPNCNAVSARNSSPTLLLHSSDCPCCSKNNQNAPALPLRYFSSSTSDDETIEPQQSTPQSSKGDTSLSDIPGSKTGGKKLAIVFTCTVCDTRSAKQFTEHAYNKGVVIVQCPGCQNRHLIADHLGFFTDSDRDGWTIEKAMARMGEHVKLVTNDNVMEVSVEDLFYGQSKAKEMSDESSTTDQNRGS